jgi:mannosyltransferase OCH1-like enzyme
MSVIPRNIFQTHKSKKYVLGKPKVLNAILSWKKFQPFYDYYFYDDQDCENFMREKMKGDIYKAYDRLPMAVMKADLWRYCIIYYYGGIYADTDTICRIPPHLFINDSLLTIVPENSVHLCQWVFSASKNSPILKSIIDLSVKRILEMTEIKGEHITHHLTGPGVFTDGIEKYLQENNLPVFENNRNNYVRYPDSSLKVFNPDLFHTKMVNHFYTGQDKDGWCLERNQKMI